MKRWFSDLLLIAVVISVCAIPAAADYVTGVEHVGGALSTPQYTDNGISYGPFFSPFSYTRRFDGTHIVEDVQIGFLFEPTLKFDAGEEAAYRAAVERNIERIWNNQFVVVDTANNATFPALVDVITTGPAFDQLVTVRAGAGRANVTEWFLEDTAAENAHEFGHMLGLYDEYPGGAVRSPGSILSDTGLMGLGALTSTPEMFPRYYEGFLGVVSALNPGYAFRLAAVPEPSTTVLLVIGAGALLIARLRGR